MARHDFWCPTCGQVLVDVNVPVALGATRGAPSHCGQPARWIPQVGRMDAGNGPGFQAFETYDGQNRKVTVDSLTKLRAIERASEADARDGRGQPMVWRRYSNDRSNQDVHSLHPGWTGGQAPDPAFVKKHGAAIRRSAEVANTDYGPGVSDATPSALDHLSKESSHE
jgi:hypothetical protein